MYHTAPSRIYKTRSGLSDSDDNRSPLLIPASSVIGLDTTTACKTGPLVSSAAVLADAQTPQVSFGRCYMSTPIHNGPNKPFLMPHIGVQTLYPSPLTGYP